MMTADVTRKVEQAADNAWVKLAARVSLPVIAFLGMNGKWVCQYEHSCPKVTQ